ncbi:trichohyalin [Lucilia sericata]|uniref:trichohyalin n=1 Tax=Lucilia sericata TaxID=13632 RepID=UPI0018A8762E|nr:trichohyalin [Lucilia sericata]
MEIIEFLQTTEQKNIKSYIGMKVKEKLQEYEGALKERQQMLANILDFENMQYNEELILLMNAKLNEQFRKRLDWLNTKRMEEHKAEEELLKLKNQQRELENCEEWRHLQSKQLLLDTKKGQLYQIEEKKMRMQKEKEIDRKWHEVMQRLNREKEYQEIYENKLLKVIENANHLKNQEINERIKKQQLQEYEQDKKEYQVKNQKALFMEDKYRRNEKRKEILSKTRHDQMLKSQIADNFERVRLETEMSLKEGRLLKEREDQQIFMELEQTEREKMRNNVWHKYYLKNCQKEKQQQLKEKNAFEEKYSNTGCVLQQSLKKPYGKSSR